MASPVKRIGLWNTAFLGDAVLTLPLAQTLRLAFADASLDLYVRRGLEPLFSANPLFTAVYGIDKKDRSPGSIYALGKTVRSREYSLWVAAHGSLRTGIISRLSGAGERIGYSETPLAGLWFTRTTSRRFAELDEIERLLELARLAGCTELITHPHVVLPPEALAAAEQRFAGFGCHKDDVAVGLHPGSVWATKRWPPEYFAEVGRRVLAHNAHVVVFAGPGEEDVAKLTLEGLRRGQPQTAQGRIHDLSGKLSLLDLAACISRLSCYVTNDSGPMHLSWAQHVPTIAVFGPTVKNLGFFPRGDDSHVVEIPLECRPCGLHGHRACPLKHHNCMRQVVPQMVWEKVKPYLK